MFYGTSESLKSDKNNIFKYYSQNGYVTLLFKKFVTMLKNTPVATTKKVILIKF